MTKALNVYNACIGSMHLTCQIINEYDVRLWHIVEEYVPPSKVDLDSRDYAFEIDSTSQNIPFECDVSIRSDSIIHKIDDKVYAIQVQSTFRFLKEVHDYFTINSSSDIFESQLQEICASYTAPAVVLGTVDYALKVSHKAALKEFRLSGYYESCIRQIAQDRHDEFGALLPWLNHFWKRLNKMDDPKKFIHLVSQLRLILTQIDCIHKYDFAAYKLLLSMAGDFSPLLNHLQKRTQTVFAN
jgi:hypothetical protein